MNKSPTRSQQNTVKNMSQVCNNKSTKNFQYANRNSSILTQIWTSRYAQPNSKNKKDIKSSSWFVSHLFQPVTPEEKQMH